VLGQQDVEVAVILPAPDRNAVTRDYVGRVRLEPTTDCETASSPGRSAPPELAVEVHGVLS